MSDDTSVPTQSVASKVTAPADAEPRKVSTVSTRIIQPVMIDRINIDYDCVVVAGKAAVQCLLDRMDKVDPALTPIPVVAVRPDLSIWLLDEDDGIIVAARRRRLLLPDQSLLCVTVQSDGKEHEDALCGIDTPAEEATAAEMTQAEAFKTRYEAGEEVAVAIYDMVESFRLHIHLPGMDVRTSCGKIVAVRKLEDIYEESPLLLEWTLRLITDAWGHFNKEARRNEVLQSISELLDDNAVKFGLPDNYTMLVAALKRRDPADALVYGRSDANTVTVVGGMVSWYLKVYASYTSVSGS